VLGRQDRPAACDGSLPTGDQALVDGAQELVLGQVVAGQLAADTAALQDQDAVADGGQLGQVSGADEHDLPGGGQAAHDGVHLGLGADVDTAGGVVEQDQRGLGGQPLDDADLDAAVDAATFGAFMNQGQICRSTERIIVDEQVADAFADKFAARVRALPCGDPRQEGVVLGSVIDRAAVERVERLVDDAVAAGARALVRGVPDGTILSPVVVDHVTPEMELFHEESFGPSVSITRVKDADEAVRLANDTAYGLSSAVFGRDLARAIDVARRIESGICHVNGPTVHDEAQMPFGGVKQSGYGRFGGRAGIGEFTELRWITIQTGPRQYPF